MVFLLQQDSTSTARSPLVPTTTLNQATTRDSPRISTRGATAFIQGRVPSDSARGAVWTLATARAYGKGVRDVISESVSTAICRCWRRHFGRDAEGRDLLNKCQPCSSRTAQRQWPLGSRSPVGIGQRCGMPKPKLPTADPGPSWPRRALGLRVTWFVYRAWANVRSIAAVQIYPITRLAATHPGRPAGRPRRAPAEMSVAVTFKARDVWRTRDATTAPLEPQDVPSP